MKSKELQQNRNDEFYSNENFDLIKYVLNQGLMRYLKKIIYDGRRTFLLRKD